MLDLRTSHAHSCWPGESRSQCRYGDPFVPRTTTLIAYRPLFHAPTRLPQTHRGLILAVDFAPPCGGWRDWSSYLLLVAGYSFISTRSISIGEQSPYLPN